MASMAFDIFARDHASRVFDKVGDNAQRLGRRIDSAGGSTGGLSSGMRDLDGASSRLNLNLGKLAGSLASVAGGAVAMAGKLAAAAGALATIGAAAASAAGYTVALSAALAPVSGLLAGLPGLALTGAAAFGVWKLATSGLGEAMSAVMSGSPEAIGKAMSNLSESGRAFVFEFERFLPKLIEFRAVAQDPFLAPLTGQMERWLTSVRDLAPAIGTLAGEFGLMVRQVLDFGTSSGTIASFNTVLGNTRTLIAGLRESLDPLLKGFVDLGTVGSTWLAGMSGGLTDVLTKFGQWMTRIAESGQAMAWLNDAVEVLKQLGRLVKDVFGILTGLLDAASAAGGNALGVLGNLVGAFNTWVNSARGQEILVEIFKALNDVGEALLPVIKALAGAIAVIAPEVGKIAKAFGPVLAKAIAALGPAIAALGPGIVAMIGGIGDAVDALAPALEPLGRAIGAAFGALRPLLAAIGPAIAALGPGVQTFFNAFATGLAALTPALPLLGAAIGGVAAALAPLLPALGQLATLIVSSLASGIQVILPSLSALVGSLVQALQALSPIIPLIVTLAASVINSLVPALAPLLPQIAALITQLIQGLVPALTPLIPIIGELAGELGQTFVSLLATIVDVLVQILPPLSETAQILGLAFLDAVRQVGPLLPPLVAAFLSALPAIADLLPPLTSLAASLLPRFVGILTTLLPHLPPFIEAMIKLTQAVYPLIPLLADLLEQLAPHIPLFAEIAAVLAGRLLPELTKFLTIVLQVVNGVIGKFTELYDRLVGNSIIPDLVNGIERWIKGLPGMFARWFGEAKDWAIGKFQELISWVAGLPGEILRALGNMGSLLFGAGRDLVTGFWNGIVSLWNWLVGEVQNLFGGLAGWAKSILGIASPSKVFAGIGREIPRGMAAGIKGAAGLVESAVQGLAGIGSGVTPQIGLAAPNAAMSALPLAPQAAPTFVFHFAGQPLVGKEEISRLVIGALNEARGRGFNLGVVGA